MKTEMVHVRMDSLLKKGAEDLFSRLGLTASSAITLFYQQVLYANGLPFPVLVPSEVTEQALRDAEAGRGVRSFDSMDSLFASLKDEECPEESDTRTSSAGITGGAPSADGTSGASTR